MISVQIPYKEGGGPNAQYGIFSKGSGIGGICLDNAFCRDHDHRRFSRPGSCSREYVQSSRSKHLTHYSSFSFIYSSIIIHLKKPLNRAVFRASGKHGSR
jgi:hypothetical protein